MSTQKAVIHTNNVPPGKRNFTSRDGKKKCEWTDIKDITHAANHWNVTPPNPKHHKNAALFPFSSHLLVISQQLSAHPLSLGIPTTWLGLVKDYVRD